jgi:hypothetical protein
VAYDCTRLSSGNHNVSGIVPFSASFFEVQSVVGRVDRFGNPIAEVIQRSCRFAVAYLPEEEATALWREPTVKLQ